MKYIDLHKKLKELINYEDEEIVIDETSVVRNFNFNSEFRDILPGGKCNSDTYEYCTSDSTDYEPDIIQEMLNKSDANILENIHFRYHLFRPSGDEKVKEVILLFHGFNEKHWAKYLTWAKTLMEQTGKAVLLFPIAFHMNRAPLSWSDAHQMYSVSEQRKKRHPEVICSTLSNVAISTRLHNKPQRFIWSGLQSYYDVIALVESIKADKHPDIALDASFDFFAYSIGGFLGQTLMMTNKNGYFTNSKLCMFCSGAVFNRLSPVSKFILDSEADVSIYSYVVEHLESHMKRDKVLQSYLSDSHPEGVYFRSMLNYKTYSSFREKRFRELQDRIMAVALEKDMVIPAYEVVNTLQGIRRDIPIEVNILDYPYQYKHEDPFPAIALIADTVDEVFHDTFQRISSFFNRK